MQDFQLSKLLDVSGAGAFGAFLNNASEVEIILPGRKLIVWRKGVWSIFDPEIFHAFFKGKLVKNAIDDLLWTVYSLSKTRHGTLVLVTDVSERELQKFKMGSVAGDHALSKELIQKAKKRPIGALKKEGELIRMLSSDGLTIMNSKGQLVDTGVITDTSGITEIRIAGGGRTTAAIAASSIGKVIKVSEDGPIDLYEDGTRRFRFG